MSQHPAPAALNAAQRTVIEALGATPGDRPAFDDELAAELRDRIAEAVAPFVGSRSLDEPLFVSKHSLATVHGCEVRFKHETSTRGFDWSVPIAVGSVAHKAIELSIHWRGSPLSLDLVDESLGRLAGEDRDLGNFIANLPEADRAQLRSDANDRVSAFQETWPVLKPNWRPVTESRVRAEFLGGRLVLSGKVDLTLGHAQGQTAGKVVVDLKTGRFRANHRDDLRFYALLETLRVGTPPRLAATYYLDQGEFGAEPVSEDVLDAAAERVIVGVARMVELSEGAEALHRPSPGCRWCPALDGCEPGNRHIEELDGTEGSDF